MRRIERALVVLLCAAGKSENDGESPGDSTGAGSTSSSATSEGSSGGVADPTGEADGSSGEIDTDSAGVECSVWEQDCAEGNKCVPWSLEDDLVPDEIRCCPTEPNPALPHEDCVVQQYFGSCLDDCAEGSMCLDTDMDLAGVCQPFCRGEASNPTCDTGEGCLIYFAGVPFCFPLCDPLIQDCPEGQGCYPGEDAVGGTDFLCLPRIGTAQLGEGCWLLSNCDPGLICVSPDFFPNCNGIVGCCTTLCDTSEPDPCDEIDPALDCVSWYVGGQQPPDPALENVGVCVIPP
ncbi:MAG TPA: hypothetical protein VFG69_16855 [Nannocystaceae bacterium]|nr:hypothetical protein [Nannocystaceae bacterium]